MIRNLFIIMNKIINRETISYLIFGILTTIVDAVTFFILNKMFKIEYILATIVAWVLAVLFAYITNKIWVFKSKSIKFSIVITEAISFFIARLVSLIFTIMWMIITVEFFKMDSMISKLLSNIFVVIMNYFFSKLFIFKRDA